MIRFCLLCCACRYTMICVVCSIIVLLISIRVLFRFEEVCVNYHHPDPRRVWWGGSELQLRTPDSRDPLDPCAQLTNSQNQALLIFA